MGVLLKEGARIKIKKQLVSGKKIQLFNERYYFLLKKEFWWKFLKLNKWRI
jgi:hypothetical protein